MDLFVLSNEAPAAPVMAETPIETPVDPLAVSIVTWFQSVVSPHTKQAGPFAILPNQGAVTATLQLRQLAPWAAIGVQKPEVLNATGATDAAAKLAVSIKLCNRLTQLRILPSSWQTWPVDWITSTERDVLRFLMTTFLLNQKQSTPHMRKTVCKFNMKPYQKTLAPSVLDDLVRDGIVIQGDLQLVRLAMPDEPAGQQVQLTVPAGQHQQGRQQPPVQLQHQQQYEAGVKRPFEAASEGANGFESSVSSVSKRLKQVYGSEDLSKSRAAAAAASRSGQATAGAGQQRAARSQTAEAGNETPGASSPKQDVRHAVLQQLGAAGPFATGMDRLVAAVVTAVKANELTVHDLLGSLEAEGLVETFQHGSSADAKYARAVTNCWFLQVKGAA